MSMFAHLNGAFCIKKAPYSSCCSVHACRDLTCGWSNWSSGLLSKLHGTPNLFSVSSHFWVDRDLDQISSSTPKALVLLKCPPAANLSSRSISAIIMLETDGASDSSWVRRCALSKPLAAWARGLLVWLSGWG